MSLSYRRLLPCLVFGATSVASAADTYFTPQLDAGIEYHTDRDMTPEGATPLFKGDVAGLVANIGGIAGVRTQRGMTELRPRVMLQHYPDRDDLQEVNAYLDLRSQYKNLLSTWDLTGRFRREGRSEAELVGAGFDTFDPNNPTVDSAGRISVVKETLTNVQLRPSYRRSLTERAGFGLNGIYQQASFSSNGTLSSGSDYKSWEVGSFFFWQLRQRTELSTGLYTARFTADASDNLTRGVGVSMDLAHEFGPTVSGTVSLDAERTKVEEGTAPTDESTNFGLNVGLTTRGETSQWRLTAGRTINPTTYGARSNVDQVRVQYLRDLSARWKFSSAVRAFRSRAQGSNISRSDDRDFLRGEVEILWNVTRTWYATAGYSYARQEYKNDLGPGDNNIFAIRFGYQGLPPQWR